MTTTKPKCHQAIDRLLDLAEETRPDIPRDKWRGAILAAQTTGWPWERIMPTVALLLARGEEPRDLIAATMDPVRGRRHRTEQPR